MMKKIQLTMFMTVVVLSFLISGSGLAQTIDWKSYPEGIRLSKKENKKVFLHFRADWCGYCKKMDATTFSDEQVIRFLDKYFIAVKVDGDKERSVTNAYRVNSFPDNRFLGSSQKQVYRVPGFVPPENFLVYLEYIHTDSYKTMTPMEYYKSR